LFALCSAAFVASLSAFCARRTFACVHRVQRKVALVFHFFFSRSRFQ
jgi:hypothetical protein